MSRGDPEEVQGAGPRAKGAGGGSKGGFHLLRSRRRGRLGGGARPGAGGVGLGGRGGRAGRS